MTGTMSKALKAAALALSPHVPPSYTLNPDVDDIANARDRARYIASKTILAFLTAALEDEELGSELVQIVADATGINRPGRMENEAVLAILEKLIARAQS